MSSEVNVKFLDTADAVHGSLLTEMCPQCYALTPTDKIQVHIDTMHAPPSPPDIPEPPPVATPL